MFKYQLLIHHAVGGNFNKDRLKHIYYIESVAALKTYSNFAGTLWELLVSWDFTVITHMSTTT